MAVRRMSITYGGLKVGGTSEYMLDGFTRHAIQDGVSDSFIEFEVVISAPTIQEFADKCQSLELAFRRPRQNLAVEQEGHTLLVISHDQASGGFNAEPEIRKVGEEGDTGRSRRYTVRISYETPADTVSTLGLRESVVNVSYDEARIRTIRISGVFTGVPSEPDARTQYESLIDTHAAAVLSALSVTASELTLEPMTEHDYDGRVLRFERTYEELIFGQGQDDAVDDPEIVKQSLTISRREWSDERSPLNRNGSLETVEDSPGGTSPADAPDPTAGGNVQALAVFDLRYDCTIDATSTTDLKAKYDSIRQWLLGQFTAAFAQGAFALTVERPDFDRPRNRISVEMTAEGAVKGIDYVRRTATSKRTKHGPKEFVGAWTGNSDDFYIYEGHGLETRTSVVVTRFLNTKDETQAEEANEAAALSMGGGGGGGHLVDSETSSTKVRIGIEGSGHLLDMLDVTSSVTTRKANDVSRASGGVGNTGDIGAPGVSGGGSTNNKYGLSGAGSRAGLGPFGP